MTCYRHRKRGRFTKQNEMLLSNLPLQRFILIALVATLFFVTGIHLFYRPEYEVMYSRKRQFIWCEPDPCHGRYAFEIGNSGRKTQEQITITFPSGLVEAMFHGPNAYAAGIIKRPFKKISDQDGSTWLYGEIKPGRKVVIYFVLSGQTAAELPEARELALQVKPARGQALAGSAEFVTLARFLAFFI